MTIYDLWLYLIQSWFSTLTFCKNHPTVPGLIYLIFKQNSIRKIINKQLPKKFRDTVDADILEIKDDLKLIKKHLGVIGVWESNGQQNGLKRHPLSFNKLFVYLRMVIPQGNQLRRKNMLTNLLRANLSKKLISALVAIGVTSLNQKFNLNLSESQVDLVLGLSLAHISLQTIIDSIKAWGLSKATTIVHEITPVVQNLVVKAVLDPNTTFQDLFPKVKEVHAGLNKIYADIQKNDGSQAFRDSLQAYNELHTIFQSIKPPEPVPEIIEAQVSA